MVQGVFPAGTLSPAPGGLFSAADVTRHSASNEKWAGGPYGWDSVACPTELHLADFCANAAEGIIASGAIADNGSWPFGVVAKYECYTVGLSVEERRKIAREQAEASLRPRTGSRSPTSPTTRLSMSQAVALSPSTSASPSSNRLSLTAGWVRRASST